MSQDLTPGQCALLESQLLQAQKVLQQTLHDQLGGEDRVAHAREHLLQDLDGEPAHDSDRELDLAASDRTVESLRKVNAALARLREHNYGRCEACDEPIAFDRLKACPDAERCVPCQAQTEHAHGEALAHHSL